jgi:hypothetical protein
MVPLNPSKTLVTTGLAATSYIYYCVEFVLKIWSRLKVNGSVFESLILTVDLLGTYCIT